ncbi:hypothetical protein Y11_21191 [Yersinia enterocolitica subsp. palearctica Y11]|uniref:Uncharacterized protein n=1 Tax=Yersinia enterocolitica subsp. palearctica serotype O:3 (strain DSM 13030 / CIP 106945 / Y11) TaxID=930944 RepID=A0A0H3NRX5_YERE1|nr:hypothetical protein DJ62_2184 [Yersinia enterocolitica]CBY26062.1 hypothetical protein Y11_21191 [Yersinia enterocolitica subsp. palearctica Y11]CCO69722.1 hypothetical protein D322_2848 [Yersinia enterocolitica IP 10393]
MNCSSDSQPFIYFRLLTCQRILNIAFISIMICPLVVVIWTY